MFFTRIIRTEIWGVTWQQRINIKRNQKDKGKVKALNTSVNDQQDRQWFIYSMNAEVVWNPFDHITFVVQMLMCPDESSNQGVTGKYVML